MACTHAQQSPPAPSWGMIGTNRRGSIRKVGRFSVLRQQSGRYGLDRPGDIQEQHVAVTQVAGGSIVPRLLLRMSIIVPSPENLGKPANRVTVGYIAKVIRVGLDDPELRCYRFSGGAVQQRAPEDSGSPRIWPLRPRGIQRQKQVTPAQNGDGRQNFHVVSDDAFVPSLSYDDSVCNKTPLLIRTLGARAVATGVDRWRR
jgi:hypothetical protein